MKFNERILDLRKKKGWSQEELGEKVGVSRQTVSKWENGQTTPELEKLRNLAKIFEISVDDLISEDIEINTDNKQEQNDNKIQKKKKSKIAKILLYFFVVAILFYFTLVIYRYNIITKIRDCFWDIHMETSSHGYYMEKRTFGTKFNSGIPMTKEEHYYYIDWFDKDVSEENEIARVKIKKYNDSLYGDNLLEPCKTVYIDNIWLSSDEHCETIEFDEINKTYKKIENYQYLSYFFIIKTEFESFFNIINAQYSWINDLKYAMDFNINIAKTDEGYYMSNEKENEPKQENHCYIQISNERIIFEKVLYDEEMKANYSGTRYKLCLGTTDKEDVAFPNMEEYTEIVEE